MATLHVFNPEHDMALAAHQRHFTAPHAGRQLRADLGFLPALWAGDDDAVLVDDAGVAAERLRHLHKVLAWADKPLPRARMVERRGLGAFRFDRIDPWGWDESLATELSRDMPGEAASRLMPDGEQLDGIRNLSSRRTAASHLQHGAVLVTDVDVLKAKVAQRRQCVLKAPWSSSGRGIRYVNLDDAPMPAQVTNWAAAVIHAQGGLVVEPFFHKVADFGLEFCISPQGRVAYRGLSLFRTVKGAYSGSVLATEADKEAMLAPLVSPPALGRLRQALQARVEPLLRGRYVGPFGIDCMVVANDATTARTLQVEVAELNLRRTMGHVALALSPVKSRQPRLMRVEFDGTHYHLRVYATRPEPDEA